MCQYVHRPWYVYAMCIPLHIVIFRICTALFVVASTASYICNFSPILAVYIQLRLLYHFTISLWCCLSFEFPTHSPLKTHARGVRGQGEHRWDTSRCPEKTSSPGAHVKDALSPSPSVFVQGADIFRFQNKNGVFWNVSQAALLSRDAEERRQQQEGQEEAGWAVRWLLEAYAGAGLI